jgi:hypothetical protein
VYAWPHAGHGRPAASGDFAARECTPGPMVAGLGSGHSGAMRLRRTLRRSRGDDPVFAWAFRYALAAVVVGAGMLLIAPSPGVGWALIVFGGWLATFTSGPTTRPQGEASPSTAGVGLSSVASTRARPPNPTRARSTARGRSQPRSRGPRPIVRNRAAPPIPVCQLPSLMRLKEPSPSGAPSMPPSSARPPPQCEHADSALALVVVD